MSENANTADLTTDEKPTNAAKRESVMAALKVDAAKSDRELARQCGVSHTYVSRLRAGLNGNVSSRRAKSDTGPGGNVSEAVADVARGNVSSAEDPRAMFLNLGAQLADDNGQWLREACETLLATLPTTKPKRTKSESIGGIVGVGVMRAHEAINDLKRIPKDDALRMRGFQVITDWIRHNK